MSPGILRAVGAGLALCVGVLSTNASAETVGQAQAETITVTGHIPPAFFGSAAVPMKLSRYADGWYRSRIDASRHPAMLRLIAPARSMSREQQIAYVQTAVHHQIRWMSDATEWGEHDYWASAPETLDRGAGDMEDRAIVKLQALKALGFPSRDLFLTMGRDKVGGPITVLVARTGGRHYVLDDTGGTPYLAETRHEFEPYMSFGSSKTWIHGKRAVKSSTVAAAAAAATSGRR